MKSRNLLLAMVPLLFIGILGFGTTIQFWTCPFVSQPEDFLAPLVEQFTAQTGIKVEISVVSYGDAVVKYQAAIAAGEAPDIMYLTESRFLPLVKFGNALEPLDNYLSDDLRSRFTRPDLLDQYAATAGGSLYVVPIFFVTYLGAVNMDILQAAGVPEDLIEKMTDPNQTYTWDDLLYIATQVTKDLDGDGMVDQWLYAYPGGANWTHPFLLWYWGAGGSPTLLTDEGKPAFDTEATRLALSFLLKLKEEGFMPPGVGSLSAGDAIDLFTAGKTAFINNVWPSNALKIWPEQFSDLNYRMVYPPTGPTGARTTYYGAGLLAIARQSRHKDEAWEFIEYLLSDDSQAYLAKSYYFPVTGKLPEEFANDPRVKMYYDVLSYAIPEPMHPAMARWKAIYNSEVQAVLIGQKTPEEAAADMQRRAQQALEVYQ